MKKRDFLVPVGVAASMLASPANVSATTQNPPTESVSAERTAHSDRGRDAKIRANGDSFVLTRASSGHVILAHESHVSHESHASHHSHYSGG
jgi:hypothetical protein